MRGTAFLLSAIVGMTVATAAQKTPADVQITGHIVKPAPQPMSDAALSGLRLPPGFDIRRFADGLGHPRMIAAAGDGAVYVTRRDTGDVLLLTDRDGDGRAEKPVIVARRPQMHGIAVDGSQVYLVTVKEVFVSERQAGGSLGPLRRIIDDLPDGGQHADRTIAVGPDGYLYISVGSTCNACPETGPEHATILRAARDGSARTIYASGLRNTIGFGWHPATKALFGMDHGIDWLGDDDQPEELNQISRHAQYGWPYIYADGKGNPQDEPPGGISMEQWARMSQPPVLTYTAHAAPMQMVFYDGSQFPAEYRGDAFVAMHGSWNRRPPSGYEVVRIRFSGGRPTAIEPFVSGFLMQQADGGWAHTGRPTGLAMASDGSLLLGDEANGQIYRISYAAGKGTRP